MGCGASSPARLHPEPARPVTTHPSSAADATDARSAAAASAALQVAHLAHVSSSSLSNGSDEHGDTTSPIHYPAQADATDSPSPAAQSSLPPSGSPVSHAAAAPLSSDLYHSDSARGTPSPGAARFSLNSHRPHLSPHASHSSAGTPSVSSTSTSPQPRMSLAAFPMTDEAKAKLDRQRNKRHTSNAEHNSFSLPQSASTHQPAAAAAHSPLRASLSKGQSATREMPLSPSRSQRFLLQQRLDNEADVVDGVPAVPVSPRSQREMRLSRHASAGEITSLTRLASARSVSRRVFDIDGADGISVAPVSTTASEADGSDSDREVKERLERRRTASTRGRLTQLHGTRELMVPQRDRRLHNLSADSALLSSDDDDGRRRSLSQPSPPPPADAEEVARRPRLHLRSTSRPADTQTPEQPTPAESGTAAATVAVESPAAGDNRRNSVVSSQRRMRRFTKTRHSNAFDGTEIANRMSRYDSRGHSFNASISQDDPGWYAATVAAGADERDNNHLQVREQPAMSSSSSSSDGSISPVRVPRGHVRSVSNTVSLSTQRNRMKQRGMAGTSGSYNNLAVPGVDPAHGTHRSSQSLAVPQFTILPMSPPLSPSASAPAHSPIASYPPSAQLSPASHRHQSRGKHLALLYCTPLSSLLLSVSLHKLGYHVLTADTRSEAEALVHQQRFDLVVAEWMDGQAVLLAAGVRAGDVEGERTAVVVVCADGADEDERARVRRECAAAGCVGVMQSGISLLTVLPELTKRSVEVGCWYVDGQSAITQIAAAS